MHRVLGVWSAWIIGVLVNSGSSILFWDELLDLPIILLGADGEFEIFASDGIPVLYKR